MKIGTKSLLFGGHQFILHPAFVFVAWIRLYKSLPNWKETICIVIHDWGYWGKPNMDGAEGEQHPIWAGAWAEKHLGPQYLELCRYHSRFLARQHDCEVSKLCLADKYGVALMPIWLWVLLCMATGEINEYMSDAKYEINKPARARYSSPQEWFKSYKKICQKWIDTGDLTIKTGNII
jgi:hypothetical protein